MSLGHAHNVVKRLEELSWVERDEQPAHPAAEAGDLLEAWVDVVLVPRQTDGHAYFSPERITRRLVAELARVAHAEGRRYAFTLHAGAALVAPNVRLPGHPLLPRGRPGAVARALGLRPGEGDGNVHLLTPYDPGVFYAPMDKGGLRSCAAPALRRSRSLRAPRAGAGRASAARGDGLLSVRDAEGGELDMPKRKKAAKKSREEERPRKKESEPMWRSGHHWNSRRKEVRPSWRRRRRAKKKKK